MNSPLVSCIMPTFNRQKFVPLAIECFLKQDYPNIELIIVDDSEESIKYLIPQYSHVKYFYNKNRQSVGNKRNSACKKSKGSIIIHWDDDDWYAPDWVTRQVKELIDSRADICGLNAVTFFILNEDKKWYYVDSEEKKSWVYGATMAYHKSFWLKNQFKDMQAGEDNDFILNNNAKVHAYKYDDGYLGILHSDNVGMEPFENPKEKILVSKWMKEILKPETVKGTLSLSNILNPPLVTCIMPTADRQKYIPSAIEYFLNQDYSHKELIIIDDPINPILNLIPDLPLIKYFQLESCYSIGKKRNMACEKATGSIIVHWDDDDWYASDWISNQIGALINSDADICGLNQIQFYSVITNKYWMTKNMNSKKLWLSGATLAYRKSFWELHPFKNLQIGEDDDFIRNNNAKLYAHDYYQGFIALIHSRNTTIKEFEDRSYNKL